MVVPFRTPFDAFTLSCRLEPPTNEEQNQKADRNIRNASLGCPRAEAAVVPFGVAFGRFYIIEPELTLIVQTDASTERRKEPNS